MEKIRRPFSLILIASALSLLTACGGNAVKMIHPTKGDLQRSFTEPAYTKLENVYEINMPLSGQLERITLLPGDTITKNQVIAELAQSPWQDAVDKANADLASAKANYDYQVAELDRRKSLGQSGYVSQSILDQIKAQIEVYAAEIKKATAARANAVYEKDLSVINAPINGVILSRETEGGKWLSTGAPLLSIGDLNQIEVQSDVLTQEAQQLKVGDNVSFTSIGSPVVLKGNVKRIDPAGFTKLSSLGVEEQRVHIICSIDNPSAAALGVGYRVQATFSVGKPYQNALLVPRFSVMQATDGSYFVLKRHHGKYIKQPVAIGASTDRQIVITKGLSLEDRIVAEPTVGMVE